MPGFARTRDAATIADRVIYPVIAARRGKDGAAHSGVLMVSARPQCTGG
jgi:hypothetical protein